MPPQPAKPEAALPIPIPRRRSNSTNSKIGSPRWRTSCCASRPTSENFRKRINRDKEEAIKFANTGLLLDLTAVLDDFQRAISAAGQSEDFPTLHSGIELIEKQLLNTLQRKWGLTRFDSAGHPFDPERHEALATEPSTEHTEATVIEDYQKGYTLHGRVIRAARVRVATPLERAAGDNGSAAEKGSAASTDASLEEGA